jgi:hypothetical protein
LLIYYEDIINKEKFKPKLLEIANFFCEDIKSNQYYVDKFFDNYEIHKENGIKLYDKLSKGPSAKSQTKGEFIIFHSKNFKKEDIDEIYNFWKNSYNEFVPYFSRYINNE